MFEPIPLKLPSYPARLFRQGEKVYIFDELRKKKILLTPEEWVRQHWINFLNLEKKYPKSLMQIEGGLKLNSLQKRSDLIVYNALGEKTILAEFKAPSVKITDKTFHQIANYNSIHKIPLLLVSNGLQHYYCKVHFETNNFTFLAELPAYGFLEKI